MNRTPSFFLASAAVILFVFAVLNLLAASCPAITLNSPDPLLPLSNRWILWLSGDIELIFSAYLLVGKNNWLKLSWLAWLTTILAVYRVGLSLAGAVNFDDYLGNYLEWFLVRPKTMAESSEVLVGFLLVGSYVMMILDWVTSRKPSRLGPSPLAVQACP